jgi:O-methyltransferase involved in polyketide biosynthesis
MTERTIERKGSSTAGYTCFSRACATREKDERFRGPDDLAEIFLPPIPQILFNVPFLRKWCMRKMFPTGIHEYILARTYLFDEAFVDALDRGFSQVVLLGAGMDTRALRFQDRNSGTNARYTSGKRPRCPTHSSLCPSISTSSVSPMC